MQACKRFLLVYNSCKQVIEPSLLSTTPGYSTSMSDDKETAMNSTTWDPTTWYPTTSNETTWYPTTSNETTWYPTTSNETTWYPATWNQTTWTSATNPLTNLISKDPLIDAREVSPADVPQMKIDWVWMWLVNCIASLVCYFFARSSAKILVQRICYALPIAISTPILFGMVIGGCEAWNKDPCKFATNELSGYLFYKCYKSSEDVWVEQLWYLLPVWWLSQVWITWHIWFPKAERLATADK